MGKEHRLAERRQAILNALMETGQLSVGELSSRFDVSEVTIRADLQALYKQNMLMRTRGGALSISSLPELSFDVRSQQQSDKKARIGRAASRLIHPGDSILLDASTTALSIIPFIEQVRDLTVVTNGLKTAINLLRLPQIHILVPGGILRPDSISLVSAFDSQMLHDLHIRIGFFGCRGLTLKQGMMDINLDEVRAKRKMVEKCQTVVGVLDSGKWGQVAVATFADLNQINTVITDDYAPQEMIDGLRENSIEVLTV